MGNEQQTFKIFYPKNIIIERKGSTIVLSEKSEIITTFSYSDLNFVILNSYMDVNIPFEIKILGENVEFMELFRQ